MTSADTYPVLMSAIQDLYQGDTARKASSSLSLLKNKAQQVTPSFEGVACGETTNPTNRDAAVRSAAWTTRTAPDFGPLWTWIGSACRTWPATSPGAYRGPWQKWTTAPILIVNNTHDPSTPITGATALHRLMPNSALLPVANYGHGAVGISCVGKAYEAYLLRGALPSGTCQADTPLFP
ncbi:alpha/beta hydrolase [Actinokineospora globicatena]|uniref:Peptidase S33 tripeptidyl aminopeptidase-like C-terminal domain-containing protein n=1 Tax=Actinokineospora globicatena TaxID=103729 RepID=A0A9W6QKF7_9PSEU|nr:alpha/beta hydrolase [Actinokineospora globicatena]GLW91305.1 hypothetical protein Aglo03_21210 [Actinokineospora globicatena]